jgi:hypothetical protein
MYMKISAMEPDYDVRITNVIRQCAFDGCSTMHYYSNGYCRTHSPVGDFGPGLGNRASSMTRMNSRDNTRTVTRGVSRNTSVTRLMSEVNGKHKNLGVHVRRITLRETAQDMADTKNDNFVNIFNASLAQNHPQTGRIGGLGVASRLLAKAKALAPDLSGCLEDSELAHMYLQFKTMDVDDDGKITIFDIRELVSSVDPEWFLSPDHRVQCLLNEAAKDWLTSASVDGQDEIDFDGFVRALLRKRSDEANNFGYSEQFPVPTELSQHPFWDLRGVVCANYFHSHQQNLLIRFNASTDEYEQNVASGADDDRASIIFSEINPLSNTAALSVDRTVSSEPHTPISEISGLSSIIGGSSPIFDGESGELSGWVFKRGYAIPVEHMNAWKLRFFRLVERENSYYLDYSNGPDKKQHRMKGSIDISGIQYFDFSPKTTIVFDASLTNRIVSANISLEKLTVFKLIMRNGRRYTLGCCEVQALNWVAELIRFGNKYQAQTDWRQNWGSYRHSRICLRDWLNAGSVST